VPGKVWLGREEGEVQILVLWTGPFSFRMAIMFSEKEGVCSYLAQCGSLGIPRMCLCSLEVGKRLYYNPQALMVPDIELRLIATIATIATQMGSIARTRDCPSGSTGRLS